MFSLNRRQRDTTTSRRIRASARFRPVVAALEGRALLSAVAPGVTAAQVAPILNFPALTVQGFRAEAGELLAIGGILGSPSFRVPVTPRLLAPPSPGACPILILEAGPVDRSLPGLRIRANPIEFRFTSTPGQPLGDLLCSITTAPNPLDADSLALGLNRVISQASSGAPTGAGAFLTFNRPTLQGNQFIARGTLLGQPFTSSVVLGTVPGPSPRCPTLTLTPSSIGFNQAGLQVQTGPIQADVAQSIPGRGSPLSRLLCQITRRLDRDGTINVRLLNRFLNRIPLSAL